MTDFLSRLVRAVFFAVLAVIGMGMALVFMLSTAVAVGILYVAARLRGKPFGARAYWNQRQTARPRARQEPFRGEVIDVEAREVR